MYRRVEQEHSKIGLYIKSQQGQQASTILLVKNNQACVHASEHVATLGRSKP